MKKIFTFLVALVAATALWAGDFEVDDIYYNILYNKINKTIREYEGGTTVYNETGGFYDFGQEVD